MPSSSVSLTDKENLLKAISMHFIVYSQKAELDDIKAGLGYVLGFGGLARQYPKLFKPLFVASGQVKLHARSFLQLCDIKYSPRGCNKREKEEEIMMNFNYYIQELEGIAQVCKT